MDLLSQTAIPGQYGNKAPSRCSRSKARAKHCFNGYPSCNVLASA